MHKIRNVQMLVQVSCIASCIDKKQRSWIEVVLGLYEMERKLLFYACINANKKTSKNTEHAKIILENQGMFLSDCVLILKVLVRATP